MQKITLWNGFNLYYNEEIVIAEINYNNTMGITKGKWCATDPTDTTVPESLRPKVPVVIRNDGTGQIWLKLKTDGYLEAYSTSDWSDKKPLMLRGTLVWRKQ